MCQIGYGNRHVSSVTVVRTTLSRHLRKIATVSIPQALRNSVLMSRWFDLPDELVIRTARMGHMAAFDHEARMYERLKILQGIVIPVCYGETMWYHRRALVLCDLRSNHRQLRCEVGAYASHTILPMFEAAYRKLIDLGFEYRDWKLDKLVFCRRQVFITDLSRVRELETDPEEALQVGVAAIMRKLNRYRRIDMANRQVYMDRWIPRRLSWVAE